MPLHLIYHDPSVFSVEDKKAISERVTQCYVDIGLPAFYVVVLFIGVDESSFYVGSKSVKNFIGIVSQHIARDYTFVERESAFIERLEAPWGPYIKERGLNWESHVENTPRAGWRENGLIPPLGETEAEKLWVKENRPVPF